jgi:hypothetical protein
VSLSIGDQRLSLEFPCKIGQKVIHVESDVISSRLQLCVNLCCCCSYKTCISVCRLVSSLKSCVLIRQKFIT